MRYLIHPRRSLCHDTPPANQSRSSPDEGVILKQYYQKKRLQENLLSCKSESCRATLGGRQFLSCLAQPRPNSNANTTYPLCNICMCMYRCCPGSQANQSHSSPVNPLPSCLDLACMHPHLARGDAADAPGQNLLGAPETRSFLCPTGFLPRRGGLSQPCCPASSPITRRYMCCLLMQPC